MAAVESETLTSLSSLQLEAGFGMQFKVIVHQCQDLGFLYVTGVSQGICFPRGVLPLAWEVLIRKHAFPKHGQSWQAEPCMLTTKILDFFITIQPQDIFLAGFLIPSPLSVLYPLLLFKKKFEQKYG